MLIRTSTESRTEQNENGNRILRRIAPKATDISKLTIRQLEYSH